MPNLKEKKEALELAQKENLTAQKDVEENTRNIQKWETETEKANLALKATQEEIAKQKLVLHEATQAAEQAWETERNKTSRQNIEELQSHKSAAERNCRMSSKPSRLWLISILPQQKSRRMRIAS